MLPSAMTSSRLFIRRSGNEDRPRAHVAVSLLVIVIVAVAPVSGAFFQFLVQPGVRVATAGSVCTLGFLFVDSDSEDIYASTAGHCVDRVGEEVTLALHSVPIGKVAHYEVDDRGTDYALIELRKGDPQLSISPTVSHWTGPSGFVRDAVDYDVVVCYYGWGTAYRNHELTRHRCGRFSYFSEEVPKLNGPNTPRTSVRAEFRGPTFQADSGGPLLEYDTGRALGLVVAGLYYPAESAMTTCSLLQHAVDAGYNIELLTDTYEPPSEDPSVPTIIPGPWPMSAWPLEEPADTACG